MGIEMRVVLTGTEGKLAKKSEWSGKECCGGGRLEKSRKSSMRRQ